MIINSDNLALVFNGFQSVYSEAYLQAPSHYEKLAMQVDSSSSDETYSWLGLFPQLREWIGQRQVNNLKAHGFTLKNRKFETTIAVKRENVADDKIGIFKPIISEMGCVAKRHPDELVFNLLKTGFTTPCFDGSNFFAANHQIEVDGKKQTVSNLGLPASGDPLPAWYLLDTSRAIRPIIWQEREKYEFQSLDASDSRHVFVNDEFLYGVRARVNAGFGLWQLAYASKEQLDSTSYGKARAAMMGFKSGGGRILGVSPSLLVVPPGLESSARKILFSENDPGGGSNAWKGSADLIVTPYIAD